jgi:quercetin dioxygenase-like cupin family protein
MKSIKIQVINIDTDFSKIEDVIINRISNSASETMDLGLSIVKFPRGVRRPWSSHDKDQYIWVVSGNGIISTVEEKIELKPGQLAFIPANTMHQHGASEHLGMTQLSIIGGTKARMTKIKI